jgi:hypothetical protein
MPALRNILATLLSVVVGVAVFLMCFAVVRHAPETLDADVFLLTIVVSFAASVISAVGLRRAWIGKEDRSRRESDSSS